MLWTNYCSLLSIYLYYPLYYIVVKSPNFLFLTMTQDSLSQCLNETEMPLELKELFDAIESLPDEHKQRLKPLAEKILDASKRRRKILTLVQDALSQLRLDMKYLVFDLEATRRERDDYQRKINE